MNNNINNNEELLKNAAKQMGTTPDELEKALNSGDFKKAMGKLSNEQSQQITKALQNEEFAKKLLSTPQAKALIKKLIK